MSEQNSVSMKILSQEEFASELQQEPKSYVKFYCCQISISILFSYFYMFGGVLLNVINRVIFHRYNFRFNFSFLFTQQIFSSIFLYTMLRHNKRFVINIGNNFSFSDFMKNKYFYFFFTLLFISNTYCVFYGNQLVVNTGIYLNLRKTMLIYILFLDIISGKSKITFLTTLSVILITLGNVITSIDDFKPDYFGYFIILFSNLLSVLYFKLTETYKKKLNSPNLKLLAYNSFLTIPLSFILIIISGEYKKLYEFFFNSDMEPSNRFTFYSGLLGNIIISCVICIFLNMSLFVSNEKNSSLFTLLLANSKSILATLLSSILLKGNKLSIKIIVGLVISTIGAIIITSRFLSKNMKIGEEKKSMENNQEIEIKDMENKSVDEFGNTK